MFKDGSMVVPGAQQTDIRIQYLQLDSNTISDPMALKGKNLTSNGTVALVKHVILADGDDPHTVYVSYVSNEGSDNTFSPGDVLDISDTENHTVTILSNGVSHNTVSGFPAVGFGSVVSINAGIYYIRKHFVVVSDKTIIIEKYGRPEQDASGNYVWVDGVIGNFVPWEATANIATGLNVIETIATSNEDSSLNDNATGTPNESAPGAHRLKITAEFAIQNINQPESGNFIRIAQIENGAVTQEITGSDYALLGDMLATRTKEESGDYVVKPFKASKGVFNSLDPDFKFKVEASTGYVDGYRVNITGTKTLAVNKARTTESMQDVSIAINHDQWVRVERSDMIGGIPNINQFSTFTISGVGTTFRVRSIRDGGLFQKPDSTYVETVLLDIFDINGVMALGAVTDTSGVSGTQAVILEFKTSNDSLVFNIPVGFIKTCLVLQNEDDQFVSDYDFNYTSYLGAATLGTDSHTATFNYVTSNTSISSSNEQDFLVYASSPLINRTLDPDEYTVSTGTSGAVTVEIAEAVASTSVTVTVHLIAPLKGSPDTAGKKQLKDNTETLSFVAAGEVMQLANYDVLPTSIVVMLADGTDVSQYFQVDDGQRNTHYEKSDIRLSPTVGYHIPAGDDLTVSYKYFEHSGNKFFTIDSYNTMGNPNFIAAEQEVDYADIPLFGGQDLRSAIDFRSSMDNGNIDHLIPCPSDGTVFETDVRYYVGRVDNVSLSKSGKLVVVEGVPGLDRVAPSAPVGTLPLHTINIAPYTLTIDDYQVTHIDNKRYTMADLGKVDRRLGKLEYQGALSMLETQASTLNIMGTDGVAKFKNGFLVDSFTNGSPADVFNIDHQSSIDPENGVLRPTYMEDNVGLDKLSTSEAGIVPASLDPVLMDGQLVIPHTTTNLIVQPKWNSKLNVNPYNVFTWTGMAKLTPATDDWKDVFNRGHVVENNDNIYNAQLVAAQAEAGQIGLGTVWGDWSTSWSGTNVNVNSNTEWLASGTAADVVTGGGVLSRVTSTDFGTQARSGVRATVRTSTTVTEVKDRFVSIELIAHMRSRVVKFEVDQMKPNTQVYAFFDGADVNEFVNDNVNDTTKVVKGVNNITQHPGGVTDLITDNNGHLEGSFFIPNNELIGFNCGTQELIFTSDPDNGDLFGEGTVGIGEYAAIGLLETVEDVTISTRAAAVALDTMSQARTISRRNIFRWDPLAQTFVINELDGGYCVTSIEVQLTSKSNNIPLQCQIRNVVNGVPGQVIIPGGKVSINPQDLEDNINVENGDDLWTEFVFDYPVYLKSGEEYCFVLMTNCDEYRVRVAEVGERDYQGNMISSQAHAGVLFTSANNSTWTAIQNTDMTFRLNRAVFDTNGAKFQAKNKQIEMQQLNRDPLRFKVGSSEIKVHQINHGMLGGDTVILEHSLDASTTVNLNGIPLTAIAGVTGSRDTADRISHVISKVEVDNYTITIDGEAANVSGINGSMLITASNYLRWSLIVPNVEQMAPAGTSLEWKIKSNQIVGNGYTPTDWVQCGVNTDLQVPGNEYVITDNTNESTLLECVMSTDRDNITPMVDMDRSSFTAITPRINHPTDDILATNHDYIENFVPETDPNGGSSVAKYVSKTVVLNDPSDILKIYLDINRPTFTSVDIYYRLGNNINQFSNMDWVPATVEIDPAINDFSMFNEGQYTGQLPEEETFTIFQVKIVMNSINRAVFPSCKALRAIAIID
jgi:hypothetical protein